MATSKANGTWEGTLKGGRGTMKGDHTPEVSFSAATRFEGQSGSNPEELVGAALAGCFSMALSLGLEQAGMTPQNIRTSAKVHLEKEGPAFHISRIELTNEVRATGGDPAKFNAVAEETKKQCPVSKALKGVQITLVAQLMT